MRKRMKMRTLRTIPVYITLLSLVLLMVFGSFFYQMISFLSQKRSLEYFEGLSVKAEQSVLSYLEEIERAANLASYSRSIQEYLFERTPYRRLQAKRAADDLLSNIMSFSPHIYEIAFVQQGGRIIQGNGEYTVLLHNAVESLALAPMGERAQAAFSPTIYNITAQADASTPYFLFVYPIYSFIEGEFSPYSPATCLVLAGLEDLARCYIEGLDIEEATVALLEEDCLVFSNQILSQQEMDELSSADYGGSVFSMNGETSLAFRLKLEGTPWNAELIAPEAAFSRDIIPIKAMVLLFMLVGIILQTFSLGIATRQMSRPFQKLVKSIRKINLYEEKRAHVAPVQVEEIDLVGRSINDMLDMIEQMECEREENRRKLYQTSLLKKQAQLQYYRTQINPHFLYNTLECISAMARVSGVFCIESICVSMADLFRYSASDASVVTLRQEICHAESYFNVISRRTAKQYILRKDICPECWNVEVQKIILQPLFENSVKHGFEGKDGPCILLMRATVQDGNLCLLVADNGFGIPPTKLARLNAELHKNCEELEQSVEPDSSIGLFNINRRLQLAYSGKSCMEVCSRYGYYTCVKISFPAERE